MPKSKRPNRRRGMTLVELLIASAITASTAAAGTTMVYAITSAASDTRDYRTDRAEGQNALRRIAMKIRAARSVGEVTSSSITLWEADTNGNDSVDLYETSVIRYDSTSRVIAYETLVPPGAMPTNVITTTVLTTVASLRAAQDITDKRTVILAEDVSSCTFAGYPLKTETRVIHSDFTMPRGEKTLTFSGAASPRASGDYLFKSEAVVPADAQSGQKRRKVPSSWNGFSHLTAS